MKKENKQMIFIYLLLLIIIVLLIILTQVVIESRPKNRRKFNGLIDKIDINPYPNVNKECTFNVKYLEYNALTTAGCVGGYTRYDISDIILDNNTLKVSVVYSDKKQTRVGIFINDKRITSIIESISKIKFGLFDNKLFILDTNNNEANVLAYDKNGKEIYNLKKVLEKIEIKDFVKGDTNISVSSLDPNSFVFSEGVIEFSSISNNCQNGEKSKGSHYKVTYKEDIFEKPEFMNLINCS